MAEPGRAVMTLRQICDDLRIAQIKIMQFTDCWRAWKPPGGWLGSEPIMLQYRIGIATQLAEVSRCGCLLRALPAANDQDGFGGTAA